MHDELKRRLRDEVDAELGTRPPSDLSEVVRRGRGKRLALRLATTMSMVLVGTAVIAGGLWISRTISPPSEDGRNSIQPADDETSPSEPIPCEKRDAAVHAGARCLLDGEVRFHIPAGWAEAFEWRVISNEPMAPESLLFLDNAAGSAPMANLLVIADPAPIKAPDRDLERCSRAGATVVSADAFPGAIRAHRGLDSTDPVAERIAGVDALSLDVVPLEGAHTCSGMGLTGQGVPVFTATRDTYFGPPEGAWVVGDGMKMRLYLLDPPSGSARTIAIVIQAPKEDFNTVVEAARPVLDSFQFR